MHDMIYGDRPNDSVIAICASICCEIVATAWYAKSSVTVIMLNVEVTLVVML